MGHSEIQELLGAYALDAVEPEEAAAVARHLFICPRCRNEVADHREVVGLLGSAGGTAPSGLWDRIIANLEDPPPALRLGRVPREAMGPGAPDAEPVAGPWGPRTPPPIHARAPEPVRPTDTDRSAVPIGRVPKRRQMVELRIVVAVATAAAVVIAILGVQLSRAGNTSSSTPNLAALAYRVADADPNARHVTLSSADGARTVRAVIIADGTTYLGPGNLATLPSDETYQMWGLVDGARVSLGVIGDNPSYHAFTTPAVANVIAMTVEPRGGVVTSTKAPIVAGVVPA